MVLRVGSGPVIVPQTGAQPSQTKINYQVALTGAATNYAAQERVVRHDNKSNVFSQAVAQQTHYILQEARRVTQKNRKTSDRHTSQHFRRRVNRTESDTDPQEEQKKRQEWFLGDILGN
jgi:hypothetical protein